MQNREISGPLPPTQQMSCPIVRTVPAMVFWQHMSCMHMFPFGEGCIGHPAAPDSQKLLFSAIIEPVKILGGSVMALEYTEEKLNSLDKETIKKAPFWQFPRGVPHRTDVHGWADRLV